MERICNKTEFEVEGWRKILPLINFMKDYYDSINIPSNDIQKIKLKIRRRESIFSREKFNDAMYNKEKKNGYEERKPDPRKLGNVKTIKQSWIYHHFNDSKAGLAMMLL